MWKQVAALASGLLMSSIVTAADPKIESSKASLHVGKWVMACGTLAEINHLPNRHYMNFDKKYPNQSLTALVWNKDYRWFENRYGKIDNYVGYRFCVSGAIAATQNRLQINVTNPQFIRLMAD